MPEPARAAFGRFLRSLRERSGFSLADVAELSKGTARTIDRGTLSRFERGQQRIPLTTLIPLSRIYGTDADVILERLELDEELERLGSPDTARLGRQALTELGRRALLDAGRRAAAYGYLRDAASGEADGVVDDERARLNLAIVIRSLGKNRLALHELAALLDQGVRDDYSPVIHDRISHCLRCLGDHDGAARAIERATREAEFADDQRVLAYVGFSRASLALELGLLDEASDELSTAFRRYRDRCRGHSAVPPNRRFEIDTLLRLAEVLLRAGNPAKAGRMALSAKRLAARRGLPSAQAHAEIALGEVDERCGRPARALQRWRRAAKAASDLGDRRLAFGAEFYLYRRLRADGSRALARASMRRLDWLLPWLPPHLAAVREYEELRGDAARPRRPGIGPTFAPGPDRTTE